MSKAFSFLLGLILVFQITFFYNVHDRPIVDDLNQYYELIKTGKTDTYVCGDKVRIFLQDLSQDDRKILQLMMRTP